MASQAKRACGIARPEERRVRVAVDIVARGALQISAEQRNTRDHRACARRRDQAAVGGRQGGVIRETDRVIVRQVSAQIVIASHVSRPRPPTETVDRYRTVMAGQAELRHAGRLAGCCVEGGTHAAVVERVRRGRDCMVPQWRRQPRRGIVRGVAENADLVASPPSAREIVVSTRDLGDARRRRQ